MRNTIRWCAGLVIRVQTNGISYFIARIMDDCAFIKINKVDLKVLDERSYRSTSSSLYYYLVDPSRDYRKVDHGS
jgi:hypothetical protein